MRLRKKIRPLSAPSIKSNSGNRGRGTKGGGDGRLRTAIELAPLVAPLGETVINAGVALPKVAGSIFDIGANAATKKNEINYINAENKAGILRSTLEMEKMKRQNELELILHKNAMDKAIKDKDILSEYNASNISDVSHKDPVKYVNSSKDMGYIKPHWSALQLGKISGNDETVSPTDINIGLKSLNASNAQIGVIKPSKELPQPPSNHDNIVIPETLLTGSEVQPELKKSSLSKDVTTKAQEALIRKFTPSKLVPQPLSDETKNADGTENSAVPQQLIGAQYLDGSLPQPSGLQSGFGKSNSVYKTMCNKYKIFETEFKQFKKAMKGTLNKGPLNKGSSSKDFKNNKLVLSIEEDLKEIRKLKQMIHKRVTKSRK
jgi:hypothetical protein